MHFSCLVCLSACLFVCLLACLFVCLLFCFPVCLLVPLFVFLDLSSWTGACSVVFAFKGRLLFVFVFVCLLGCLFVSPLGTGGFRVAVADGCLLVGLFVCLFVCLSVCLSVCQLFAHVALCIGWLTDLLRLLDR